MLYSTIRPAQTSDFPGIRRILNYYITETPANLKLEGLTDGDVSTWVGSFSTTGRYRLLVAVATDNTVLGFVGTVPFNPREAYITSAATTIYLDQDACGQGLGTSLYTSLFETLHGEDLHRLYAGITIPNGASIALHEKVGFQQVALYTEAGRKFGRYWDVVWMERSFQGRGHPRDTPATGPV